MTNRQVFCDPGVCEHRSFVTDDLVLWLYKICGVYLSDVQLLLTFNNFYLLMPISRF